jgi:nuclear transport factor 2 (NTF2) superfamily protein
MRVSLDRPPLPPFTHESAIRKVRAAEDAWNGRDPERVALACTPDSLWHDRVEFLQGREAIEALLARQWAEERDCRLIKELWAFREDRIAVRFATEWRDATGQWFRSYGAESWSFDAAGLMRARHASANDLAIDPEQRKFYWAAPGPRPLDHPGLTAFGL